MKFTFETENLHERLYKRLIRMEAYTQFQTSELRKRFWKENKNYTIIIRPSTRASEDPFFYGKNGVGGVTDTSKMVLYLEDKHENPRDILQRVLRTNANVISHEGGHHKLMFMGMDQRVPLRNRDESGKPAGTLLNFLTAEVLDRDIENKMFTMSFSFWDWSTFKATNYTVQLVDFRDLLQ